MPLNSSRNIKVALLSACNSFLAVVVIEQSSAFNDKDPAQYGLGRGPKEVQLNVEDVWGSGNCQKLRFEPCRAPIGLTRRKRNKNYVLAACLWIWLHRLNCPISVYLIHRFVPRVMAEDHIAAGAFPTGEFESFQKAFSSADPDSLTTIDLKDVQRRNHDSLLSICKAQVKRWGREIEIELAAARWLGA